MIDHKYPLNVTSGDLRPWLAPGEVEQIAPMPGWHNSIFRVDAVDGRQFVLRVHVPEEPIEYVKPTLRIVDACSRYLPYVPAPIPTTTGDVWLELEGRIATLWPLMGGEVRRDPSPSRLFEAARVLAEIHSVGSRLAKDGAIAPTWRFSDMDWQENRRWSLSRVRAFLLSDHRDLPDWMNAAELLTDLETSNRRVRQELDALDEAAFPNSVAHGDFYPGNLLFDASGKIVAVLDWDDARVDWTGWDIANAMLEFCDGTAGSDLDPALCSSFIAEYQRAGGLLTESGRRYLPVMIRARKLDDVMYTLDEMTRLHHADWDYLRTSLSAWRQVQSLT